MTERLRLCCELKEESCGGIHFYEMLKLKQLPKVTIITGTGLSGPRNSGGLVFHPGPSKTLRMKNYFFLS